ncbi:hypothetical protein B0H16DRAFT_1452936 [Mycena metata]|nr:hypothetical protein B0H16DRAFT_1452936 [Mycena metata]
MSYAASPLPRLIKSRAWRNAVHVTERQAAPPSQKERPLKTSKVGEGEMVSTFRNLPNLVWVKMYVLPGDNCGSRAHGRSLRLAAVELKENGEAVSGNENLETSSGPEQPKPLEYSVEQLWWKVVQNCSTIARDCLDNIVYTAFTHTFISPLVVPPLGTVKSGTSSDVTLPQGAEEAIGIIDHVNVDVDVR